MAVTWLQSYGPPLGFGGAIQGAKGSIPPGGASEAGAWAPARLNVRASAAPAKFLSAPARGCVRRPVRQEEQRGTTLVDVWTLPGSQSKG
jgi:hypothetical protein